MNMIQHVEIYFDIWQGTTVRLQDCQLPQGNVLWGTTALLVRMSVTPQPTSVPQATIVQLEAHQRCPVPQASIRTRQDR